MAQKIHHYKYYITKNQPVLDEYNQTDSHKPVAKRWLRRLVLLLLVGLMILFATGIWLVWSVSVESTKVFGGTPLGNLAGLLAPSNLKTEANGRINILAVGYSVDDPGHPAADLTDSILLISLQPKDNSAILLSIPRDLWVNIPDIGYQKINAAYHWGKVTNFNEVGYPSGGAGMLEKIVSTSLGVPIDYYALINYAALKNLTNAVGGIDIPINSPDPRGLYDPNISVADGGPLRLSNGWQHLDSQTALNLARARGDPTADGQVGYGFPHSDFDRTEHQRQIVTALAAKINSIHVMTDPFIINKILAAIGTNIDTDLNISQTRALALMFRPIKSSAMQSISLSDKQHHYLSNYTTFNGQSALIPSAGLNDYSEIQQFVNSLLM